MVPSNTGWVVSRATLHRDLTESTAMPILSVPTPVPVMVLVPQSGTRRSLRSADRAASESGADCFSHPPTINAHATAMAETANIVCRFNSISRGFGVKLRRYSDAAGGMGAGAAGASNCILRSISSNRGSLRNGSTTG